MKATGIKFTPLAEKLLDKLMKQEEAVKKTLAAGQAPAPEEDEDFRDDNDPDAHATQAEKYAFLNLRHLPGQVNAHRAGWVFGGKLDGKVPVLSSKGHLPALGHPANNSKKQFLMKLILILKDDPEWMGQANDIVDDHTRVRNGRPPKNTPATPATNIKNCKKLPIGKKKKTSGGKKPKP